MKLNILGKEKIFYESIDSTQKEIWRRIDKNNIQNGTMIMANIQTEGIGTHGRSWHTDTKNNIAVSFVIEPKCSIKKIEGITIQIAKSLVKTFEDLYNIKLEIKDPNDLVYGGKKIGGILTQTKVQAEIVKYLVIGIGINTNQKEFSRDIKEIASSIKNEFGIDVDNRSVINKFCELFEIWLTENKILSY